MADAIGSNIRAHLSDVMNDSGSRTKGDTCSAFAEWKAKVDTKLCDIDGKKHMEKTAKKVDELVEKAKAQFKSGFTVEEEAVEDGNLRITVSAANQKTKIVFYRKNEKFFGDSRIRIDIGNESVIEMYRDEDAKQFELGKVKSVGVTDFIDENNDCGKAIQTRAFRFNGGAAGLFTGVWGTMDNNDDIQCSEKIGKGSWHTLQDGVCPGEKYSAKSIWACEKDTNGRKLLAYREDEDVPENEGAVLIETMLTKIKTLTNFFGITQKLGQ